MCFLGIPKFVNNFPQIHLQVQMYVKYLAGLIELPKKEGMMDELNDEIIALKILGKPLRHFHRLGSKQWNYNQDLARIANVQNVPDYVEKLFNQVLERKMSSLLNYKEDNFKWTNNEYKIIT